jgi:hypothetical protein
MVVAYRPASGFLRLQERPCREGSEMVYARAALTHSENHALRLDEIDRPRFTEEPPKPIKWGTREKPNLQFQTAPAPLEGWVPPWRKNAQCPNALTGR